MNPQLANVIESLIDAKLSLWEFRRNQYKNYHCYDAENLEASIKAELVYIESARAELAALLP